MAEKKMQRRDPAEESKKLRKIAGDNPDGYIHYMMTMQKENDLWDLKTSEYKPPILHRIKVALLKLGGKRSVYD